MTHINAILLDSARQLISRHLTGTRYKYTFDPETLACAIEDTGEPPDPTSCGMVGDYLGQPAGPSHGTSSLGAVLVEELTEIARQHGRRSAKAISEFCAKLQYLPFNRFLEGYTEPEVTGREAKLRRRLDKLGYRLEKARTRNPFDFCYQTYTVIHRTTYEVNIDSPTNLAGLEAWVEEQLGAQTFEEVS
jgi:hypothetical protein